MKRKIKARNERYNGDGASFLCTLHWGWRVLPVDATLGMARPPHNEAVG
ncbi:hypothetical protein A2U01_0082202, partial [Trifolium medium]|nr:hypothetical protein [Trifolium medium]